MRLMLAAVLACSTAMASADPPPATDPAALFGAREAIGHVNISPSGERLAYMVPGPGRGSILYTIALAGRAPQVAIYSDMNPERLRWCNFVSGARLICEFDLIQKDGMTLIPFIRLVAADADGANIKLLGTRSSGYETYISRWTPRCSTGCRTSRTWC
ncbi:MAG: hypothetical protein AVDCRST_MAG39-2425 [uncultured Sphingomonadaceae bacterium]|uniref:Uncharacterized protein n=1 Tax=uncultured Sphingomonadaceae bacterium TaxID=169976 RepID=A0A6J4T7X6_9SPHN|nr:MAG: hypothetical protein AVDCRST_MAG39-2425 [uncultured Sphingomonadaceae bacterium]